MILIIGRFQVKPGEVANFQALARRLIPEERKVAGCIHFDILQDTAQSDRFVMLEEWRNQAALDHHTASADFSRNEATVNSFIVGEAEWEEYSV